MAKAAVKGDPFKPKVETNEEADQALRRMGELENLIEHMEKHYEDKIVALRAELIDATHLPLEQLDAWAKALEKYARRLKKEKVFEMKIRSVVLNFGSFGFRWGNWNLRYEVKVDTIINRLKAKGQPDLLRVKETPNKEKLRDYDNEFLEPLGMKKTRSERFFYELKREEVKG